MHLVWKILPRRYYNFNNLQPHLTLDVKVPLFPLSDTSLTVPAPQSPERLMSEGISLLHILSTASTPFKTKLSDDVFILVMISQQILISDDQYSIPQMMFLYHGTQKSLFLHP